MYDYSKLDNPEVLPYIFHPRKTVQTRSLENSTDVDFEIEENVTISCRFHLTDKQSPVVLYFHGNGEVVDDYDEIGPLYNKTDMNLLVTDYRGYGWSSGSPTVTSMFNDAHHLLLETQKWLKKNNYTGHFFVMGRSLGSACAIDLCQRESDRIKGLIIESGFCETLPLIRTLGIDPSGYDIKESECFNNCQKISKVKIPTLILHGSNDSLIPCVQGEKLHVSSGAQSKQFQVIPGADHNTMILTAGMEYFNTIKTFVDRVTGKSSWRNRRRASKRNKQKS